MKLGISRPRRTEYRPRKIDAQATKAARTRHAQGVKRLQEAFGLKPHPIPAPGNRAPGTLDPAEARARRRRQGNWTGRTFRTVRGRLRRERNPERTEPVRIRRGVRLATLETRRGTFAKGLPSVTARERTRRRKAARKARKANRR